MNCGKLSVYDVNNNYNRCREKDGQTDEKQIYWSGHVSCVLMISGEPIRTQGQNVSQGIH